MTTDRGVDDPDVEDDFRRFDKFNPRELAEAFENHFLTSVNLGCDQAKVPIALVEAVARQLGCGTKRRSTTPVRTRQDDEPNEYASMKRRDLAKSVAACLQCPAAGSKTSAELPFTLAQIVVEELWASPKGPGTGSGRMALTAEEQTRRKALVHYARSMYRRLKAEGVDDAADVAAEEASRFGVNRLGINLGTSTIKHYMQKRRLYFGSKKTP